MVINESMLRRAIMQRTDISAANKLVLLALLLKVSWETWQGPATMGELASLSGLSKRAIQTSIKKLDGSLILRSSTSYQGKSIPLIKLLTDSILEGCKICMGEKCAGCKMCTQRGEKYSHRGEKYSQKGEKYAPLQYIQYTTTNNTTTDKPIDEANEVVNLADNQSHSLGDNWGEITDQINANELAAKANISEHKLLNADQKAIIQKHIRFAGHGERVRVARKYLNIKLLKGGYYEPII